MDQASQRGFKVSQHCREGHPQFQGGGRLQHGPPQLTLVSLSLSGCRLVCHSASQQACLADLIIEAFRMDFPHAHDRDALSLVPPHASELNFFARLRDEPESEEDTSPDKGVPPRGSGWCGCGSPMLVGSGYTSREMRWSVARISWKVAHGVWHVSSPRLLALCIVTVVDLLLRSRHT